jgi:hypothetical protein
MHRPPCHRLKRQRQRGELVAFLSFLTVIMGIGYIMWI